MLPNLKKDKTIPREEKEAAKTSESYCLFFSLHGFTVGHERLVYRTRSTGDTMLRAPDDVLLKLFAEAHEKGAVPGHTHDQILMFLRMYLCVQ